MTFPIPATLVGVLPAKPKDAFTVDEYAKHSKIEYKTAVSRLTQMAKIGRVKIGQFQSTNTRGRTCAKNFYQNI